MTQTGYMREARRVSGMTQTDAAAVIGISAATYNRFEAEFGEFRVGQVITLAKAMGDEGRDLVRRALVSFFDDGVGV